MRGRGVAPGARFVPAERRSCARAVPIYVDCITTDVCAIPGVVAVVPGVVVVVIVIGAVVVVSVVIGVVVTVVV